MHDMMTIKPVSHVTHPLVSNMYLKKEYTKRAPHEDMFSKDVLVIETYRLQEDDEDIHTDTDSHLFDLLSDLQDLKRRAEVSVGHIDRVDIRTH